MRDNAPNFWGERLAALGDAFATSYKQLRKISADPFEVVGRVNSVRQALKGVGIDADQCFDAILPVLQSECVRLEAEFWGLLTQACAAHGWDVLGSTNRRLVNKAMFVSLEGSAVKVEGVAGACTPFVPSLMPTLARTLEEVEASEGRTEGIPGRFGEGI
jgi:hypothetical protein